MEKILNYENQDFKNKISVSSVPRLLVEMGLWKPVLQKEDLGQDGCPDVAQAAQLEST